MISRSTSLAPTLQMAMIKSEYWRVSKLASMQNGRIQRMFSLPRKVARLRSNSALLTDTHTSPLRAAQER